MQEVKVLDNQGWDSRILVASLGDLVQTFLVVTRRYVVVVDTMINPDTAAQLLRIAREAGQGRRLLVVNTHADWDHYWGNQVFDSPILGSKLCRARAVDAHNQKELKDKVRAEPATYREVRLTPPSVAFQESLVVDGGDLTLELFPTPGHQPDHIAVFIPEIKTLLAGDAAEQPFPLVSHPGGIHALRTSLQAMLHHEPRHAFYCHAPVEAGPALIERNLAYFERMERLCAETGLKEVPPEEEIEARAGFPFEEALPRGVEPGSLPAFYRESHRTALKEMLLYLGADAGIKAAVD